MYWKINHDMLDDCYIMTFTCTLYTYINVNLCSFCLTLIMLLNKITLQVVNQISEELRKPVFPFSMLSAKQGNYWYHYYNVFGMTRSLTGDSTRDLPHSKPALYH